MKPLPHACCVLITAVASTLAAGGAWAKLPQPSDEAKAKAAEGAAKAAHAGKVANFQLCKSMDRVTAGYQAALRKAGKPVPTPVETPACADPGAFVYPPPAPVAAAAPAASVAKK